MASYVPRFSPSAYGENSYIDLRNVPRNAVTVTVSVQDEKLKKVIEDKISSLKVSKSQAINAEEWGVVHRVSLKIKVLEEVLRDASF